MSDHRTWLCEAVPFGTLFIDSSGRGYLPEEVFYSPDAFESALEDFIGELEARSHHKTDIKHKTLIQELIDVHGLVVVRKFDTEHQVAEAEAVQIGYNIVGSRPRGLPSYVSMASLPGFIQRGLITPETQLLKVSTTATGATYPDGTVPKKAEELFSDAILAQRRASNATRTGIVSDPNDLAAIQRELSQQQKPGSSSSVSLVVYANDAANLARVASIVEDFFGSIRGQCVLCTSISGQISDGRFETFENTFRTRADRRG